MALKQRRTKTVGYLPHDAVVRVDKRVREILARREAALQHARRGGERLKRPWTRLGNRRADHKPAAPSGA